MPIQVNDKWQIICDKSGNYQPHYLQPSGKYKDINGNATYREDRWKHNGRYYKNLESALKGIINYEINVMSETYDGGLDKYIERIGAIYRAVASIQVDDGV